MANSAVMEMIPEDTLKRIKENDPKPMFRVYSFGHEGEANGKEVGVGKRVVKYFKEAIVQLAEKTKIGTKFFDGHNADNSTTNRESLGEVVGKSLKTIDGKLHALAAAYIKPAYRDRNLDVASFEGNVYLNKDRNKALSIESVSGIALGNSKLGMQPAFTGAELLATVQNFTPEGEMTLAEIKAAIAAGNFKITDLYSEKEITSSEPAMKLNQEKHEHARRLENKLGEEREKIEKLTKDNDELSSKVGKLNSTINSRNVSDLLKKSYGERKLHDTQKKFIEKQASKFSSEKEGDELKVEVEKFIDQCVNDYADTYEMMTGKKPEFNDEGSDENKDGKGTPSADGKDSDTSDLTNPENNDFIPA